MSRPSVIFSGAVPCEISTLDARDATPKNLINVTLSNTLPFSLILRLGGTGGQLRVLKVTILIFSVFRVSLFAVSQESTSCNEVGCSVQQGRISKFNRPGNFVIKPVHF